MELRPVTMALTATELHELSDGLFTLGIGTGTGTAHHNENVHSIYFARPIHRMSEYLKVIQDVSDSHDEPFEYEGEHFTVRSYRQPYFRTRPPLILAAVGERMLRLTARQADSVIMNPSATPWYVRTHVTPQLAAGAAQSGRPLQDVQRSTCLRCSVDTDRATARESARHDIVEYGRYPVHQAQYGLHGFGREAELIRAAAARDDITAAVAAVSDEMVDILGLAGTPDDVRRPPPMGRRNRLRLTEVACLRPDRRRGSCQLHRRHRGILRVVPTPDSPDSNSLESAAFQQQLNLARVVANLTRVVRERTVRPFDVFGPPIGNR